MNRISLPFLFLFSAFLIFESAFARYDFLERVWSDHFRGSVRMSPGGRYYAYSQRKGEISEIHMVHIANNTKSVLSSRRDSQFFDYRWVDEENIIVSEVSFAKGEWPSYVIQSYSAKNAKRNLGAFNRPSKLAMAANVNTSDDIVPSVLSGVGAVPEIVLVNVPTQSFFVDPRRRRDELGGGRPDVVELNVISGKTREVAKNPGNVDFWISDSKGQVRVGVTFYGKRKAIHRPDNESEFELLDLPEGCVPFGFLPDNQRLMVFFDDKEISDTVGFRIYDLEKREFATRLISDKRFDMAGYPGDFPSLQYDQATGTVIGLRYATETFATLWLDPQMREVQKRVDTLVPAMTNRIIGLAESNDRLLFVSNADVEPGKLLQLDLKTGEISVLLELYPNVRLGELATIKPVQFKSRDGVDLFGYLTLPLSAKPGDPLPFINVVHGGPHARDTWGFSISNREAQVFASMGFAVLQVNFRGSTGYGRAYQGDTSLYAAQYGVEDVADGTRWAIEQGIADPARCVVYGASFGGYSAMQSAVEDPDLYKVAIGSMGVYDWLEIIDFDLKRSHPLIWEILKDRYGDYEGADREALIRWSPARNAGKIKIPVMLVHGVYDRRVDIKQYDLMRDALKREGVMVESFKYTRGGHGFDDQIGWVSYYKAIMDYLDKYVLK